MPLIKRELYIDKPIYLIFILFLIVKTYGGKSCIDVAQSAFKSIVKDRKLDKKGNIPGENDLKPIEWFQKLKERANEVNKNSDDTSKHIQFTIPKKTKK